MRRVEHQVNRHRRFATTRIWIVVLVATVWVAGCADADQMTAPESLPASDEASNASEAPQDESSGQARAAADPDKAYLLPLLADDQAGGLVVSFTVVAPAPGVTALVSTWHQTASGVSGQRVLHTLPVVAGENPPTVPMQPICNDTDIRDLVGVELHSMTDGVEIDVHHSRFLNPASDVCSGFAAAGAEQRPSEATGPAPVDNTAAGTAAGAATDEEPMPEEDTSGGTTAFVDEEPMPEEDTDGAARLGPPAGARLDMIGVEAGDFLNVRDMPGGEIVARLHEIIWQPVGWRYMLYGPAVELEDIRRDGPDAGLLADPTETVIVATGNARRLLDGGWHPVWYEIEVGGVSGWASGQHLGVFGQTVEVADQVASALDGVPSADTLQHLADAVIEALIPEYHRDSWSVVLRSGPGVIESSGDLVVDVITVRDGLPVGYQVGIVADNHGDCLISGDCESRCCDWTSDYGAPFTLRFAVLKPICDPSAEITSTGACA